MIKRQRSVFLLSSLFRQNHHNHHHQQRNWGCRFMAPTATVTASLDPLCSRELVHRRRHHHHHHHHHHQQKAFINKIGQSSSLGKVWSAVGNGGFSPINGRQSNNGLILKNCSDNWKRVDDNTATNGAANAVRKAWAFAPSLPQLVGHADALLYHQSGTSSGLVNGHGGSAYHGQSPVGFPPQQSPDKIVVAVDVDEVLGNFISALNRFIADRYSLNHSVSEYHVYEFFKIWNCSRDEADIRVHEFFKTPYFKSGIHPIPGARQALQKLSTLCNLSIVTSRQNAIKDHTIEWIEKHYPGLFQEIHFGNHFALDGQSRSKSEICRSLGAKVLIDDNPRYAVECAEVGIKVLLFDYENSYPWCKTESVDRNPLVTKVHNWEEVEHELASYVLS